MNDDDRRRRLLVSLPEAAEILCLGRSTVYGLVARGEIPTIRIGRAVRIQIGALEEWVEQRSAEPGPRTPVIIEAARRWPTRRAAAR
jgi:excisionase family DNA binding protein